MQAQETELRKGLFDEKYQYTKMQIFRFSSCSADKLKIIPINNEVDQFAISGKNLDAECLKDINKKIAKELYEIESFRKEQPSLTPKLNNFEITFNNIEQKQVAPSFQILEILSPFNLKCGETCEYATDKIIKMGDNYYFLIYPNDFGINAKVISNELILFEAYMFTHKRNVVLNINLGEVIEFPDGNLEFLADGVLVYNQKSYFKNGGAFWYDSKIDYKGELIELIDAKYGECLNSDDFNDHIKTILNNAEKSALCVMH